MLVRRLAMLAFVAVVGVSSCVWAQSGPSTNESLPVTGDSVPALAALDSAVSGFVSERNLPGVGLAVMKNGRVIYNRGFGFSEKESAQPWQPDSLCRIASVSKPITAVAVMRLVQEGKVKLDEPILSQMSGLQPWTKPGTQIDPRVNRITVRQCLQHRGGWDRDAGKFYDPINDSWQIALDMGVPAPASAEGIVRYTLGSRPLDFDPGTRYAYSNFGYLVLGRLIEKVSGQTYEQYVRDHVLAPAGITDMRVARSLFKYRFPKEVRYYDLNDERVPSVFDEIKHEKVPYPYGSVAMESIDANGGWVATPSDLVKFMDSLVYRGKILDKKTLETMAAKPQGETGSGWYGCGLNLQQDAHGIAAYHQGGLYGCCFGCLQLRSDGITFAFLSNRGARKGEEALASDLQNTVQRALDGLRPQMARL